MRARGFCVISEIAFGYEACYNCVMSDADSIILTRGLIVVKRYIRAAGAAVLAMICLMAFVVPACAKELFFFFVDEGIWDMWRVKCAYNIDGDICMPEEFGAENVVMATKDDGSGILLIDGNATPFGWKSTDYGLCFQDRLDLVEMENGEMLYYPNAEYGENDSAPFIVFESTKGTDDSSELYGEWILEGSQGELVGLDTTMTLSFGEDGYLRYKSAAADLLGGLFGYDEEEDVSELISWMVIGDRLITYTTDGTATQMGYAISGDTIELFDEQRLADATMPVEFPLHYDSMARYEKLSGRLFGYKQSGEETYAYIFDLKSDGSGVFACADSLIVPENVYEQVIIQWNPDPDGIRVTGLDGKYDGLLSLNSDYDEAYFDCEYGSVKLRRSEKFDELVASGTEEQFRTLTGVWEQPQAWAESGISRAQLFLNPDGTAEVININSADNVYDMSMTTSRDAYWKVLNGGVLLSVSYENDVWAELELGYADGQLYYQGAPMQRVADQSAFDGEEYRWTRYANYMQSGCVGIWRNETYYDPMDEFGSGYDYYFLDAYGVGIKKSFANGVMYPTESVISWMPDEDGFTYSEGDEGWYRISTHQGGGDDVIKLTDFWTMDETMDLLEFGYTLNEDGTATLTDYVTSERAIEVPASIDGYAVTSLAEGLFEGDASLVSVVLPEGLTRIGARAFSGCVQMESVTFPTSLTEIGESAFDNCSALTSLSIPNVSVIGDKAFRHCAGMNYAEIYGTDVIIGNYAFSDCNRLENAMLSGIVTIGDRAFRNCVNLTGISMEGVKNIGEAAFYRCDFSGVFTLPDGLETIGADAFSMCIFLDELHIPISVYSIGSDVVSDTGARIFAEKGSYAEQYAIENGVGLTSFSGNEGEGTTAYAENFDVTVLADGSVEISRYTGDETEIVIPSEINGCTVSAIGAGAFADMYDITRVQMPETLRKIGDKAFFGCESLVEVTMPAGAVELGKFVFANCPEIVLTDAMKSTGQYGDMSEEDALRWLLTEQTGEEYFLFFNCGDYDGDGLKEAFALVGYESGIGYEGDIWFVGPYAAECVLAGCNFYTVETCGESAPLALVAEEGYGGSGSVTHVWTVYNGLPQRIDMELYGTLSYESGKGFCGYMSAFDGFADGTGHTWKCYYFFLDGLEFKEYGGIYITIDQFMMFDGADAVIDKINNGGYTLQDIIYRGNGIININLTRDGANDNMTLMYDETSVTDLEVNYGGVYQLAYDSECAVYPESFIEPVNNGGDAGTADGADAAAVQNGKQSIWDELGVLNYGDLINVSSAEGSTEGEYQRFVLKYAGEMITSSEGYINEWLVDEGIFAEMDVDLDSDGADEYLVMYESRRPDKWGYVRPEFRIAIYENENGAYRCAADFASDFDILVCGGECYARITEANGRKYIAINFIGYGEGNNGYLRGSIISYDGTNAYAEQIIRLNTMWNGFVMTAQIPAAEYLDYAEYYSTYAYDPAELAGRIAVTDETYVDCTGYGDGSGYGSFNACGQLSSRFGLNVYCIPNNSDNYEWYEVFVEGGTVIAEVIESFDADNDYNNLRFVTSLVHLDASFGADTAADAVNETPAGETMPAATSGTVVFHGDSNLRSGPGLGYETVSSITAGKSLVWLGESSVDDRGVVWYKVQRNNGEEAWVSSRYSTLETEDGTEAVLPFSTLMNGSKGENVRELQEMLKTLGYHDGSCDGDYGGKTQRSVEAFQTAYGLPVTGQVDEATWNTIKAAIAE